MYAIVIDGNRKKEYEFSDECIFDNFRIIRNTIILNEKFYFKSGTCEALPDHFYVICNGIKEIQLFLYSDSLGISDFNIYERKDMIISAKNDADIINLDPFYRDNILRIEKNSLMSNACLIFVNNFPYLGQDIKNGDFLEILGLKCYLYENFIYLNSFRNTCQLKKIKLDEKILKLKIQKPQMVNFHEGEQIEFKIKKLNKFTHPIWNKRSLLSQVGPAITMALTLCAISSINIYSSYLMNGFSLTMVAMGLMPLTIILSGVVWPFVINQLEKKNYEKSYKDARDKYLKYLKEYKEEVTEGINAEIKYVSQYVFNPEDITSKLFYVTLNNNHFLNLYLGKYNRHMDFEYENTGDGEIDDILKSVKYHLNNIIDYPLYLELKKYSRVTIRTKDRIASMKEVLLELSYKHHYDDLFIIVYCKDDRVFEDFLALPHLYHDEKRYTLTSERDLSKINSLKTSMETVVLLCDYSDVVFRNTNVHTIYFTEDERLLKDSEVFIDYTGLIASYICTNRQDFVHENTDIAYADYFEYISRTRKYEEGQSISFKNIFSEEDILFNYSHTSSGLKASFACSGQEMLDFDLHETKDGPHGLIGGSTGSGKSELIISMLLSLALRYSPEYLNMIIVDYKGAGIVESLTYKDRTLPHVIASLSNLDEAGFERLSIAIGRICTRRQQLFKELSHKCQQSIMSIDDYLQNCEAYGFEKLAHLLIVVDEFAELKKSYPDSISKLISFSRIGRSLGLHLILATQKPSGVIDEEIWSNSHFKIALKLNSERDSRDIIKKDDAAFLLRPGDFCLLVDDSLMKGHSIYAKKDINGNEDYSVALLNRQLAAEKKAVLKAERPFMESAYFCEKILDICDEKDYRLPKLKFEKPLPLKSLVLKKKYSLEEVLVFGETDDYLNASYGAVSFKGDESIMISSTRKKEIINVLNGLNAVKRASVIIGHEKYMGGYIRESLLFNEKDDILFLFRTMLNDNISFFTLLIDDLNTFLSLDEEYGEYVVRLLNRSNMSGFSFIFINRGSSVNYKILNSFTQKLLIEMHDKQDIISLFGASSRYKADSYYYRDEAVPFVPCIIEDYVLYDSYEKAYIKRIPESIMTSSSVRGTLIGYDIRKRDEIFVSYNDKLLITSYDEIIIEKYQGVFEKCLNIDCRICSEKIKPEDYDYILFCGEGIVPSKLFYCDIREELKEKEGILYHNYRCERIVIADE